MKNEVTTQVLWIRNNGIHEWSTQNLLKVGCVYDDYGVKTTFGYVVYVVGVCVCVCACVRVCVVV